ncbi:hypothetical protein CDAR_49431 [Caerostris darwini]|uniref:Uncharacterized protein n=1 Tax=Caerostris darwini TaxID=1538125 RepID=A0AAV4Q7U9_9ARAC|nr:hypothetical protein CDAR_49431 [Caerostris darwini]
MSSQFKTLIPHLVHVYKHRIPHTPTHRKPLNPALNAHIIPLFTNFPRLRKTGMPLPFFLLPICVPDCRDQLGPEEGEKQSRRTAFVEGTSGLFH